MNNASVWFHNHSASPSESLSFYEKLLGWRAEAGPPGMTMFSIVRDPGGATVALWQKA